MVNVFAMDELSREFTVAEKELDIQFAEIAYMEAMIDAKLKINMAKSELKVMCESTEEHAQGDLVYLYNEAAKEAEANGESIFVKAKNAVVSFFISAWNSIQKVFTKHDTEAYTKLKASKAKVKLPMDVAFFANAGSECCDIASGNGSILDKAKGFVKAFGIPVAAGAGAFGAFATIRNKCKEKASTPVEMTEAEAVGVLEKLKNLMGKFVNPVKSITEDKDSEAQEKGIASKFFNFLGDIGKYISSAISKLRSALHLDIKDPDEVKSDILDEEGKHVENNKPANVKDPNPA